LPTKDAKTSSSEVEFVGIDIGFKVVEILLTPVQKTGVAVFPLLA